MASNPLESPASAAAASSAASVEPPQPAPSAPSTGRKIPYRTGIPRPPPAASSAFQQATSDEVEIGNKQFEMTQFIEGTLGHRFSRANLEDSPHYVELQLANLRNSFRGVCTHAILRILYTRGFLPNSEINNRAATIGRIISQGSLLLIYKKLRNIHLTERHHLNRFARKPKVTDNIEVPLPFAYVIQALGKVKVNSMTSDLEICPTFPDGTANFGMETGINWNPTEHAQCIEYIKGLGIPCCTVDLGVKIGSAWWLLRHETVDSTVRISCPLPESNFTEQSAVMSTMFLLGDSTVIANDIADLSSFNDTYGILIQNPHAGICISTFYAIANMSASTWHV